MKRKIILSLVTLLLFTGCLSTVSTVIDDLMIQDVPLTEAEVARGLKEALSNGAEHAVSVLGKTDGYYGNPVLQLLLPPEADAVIENINRIPGGEKLLEDLILRINRSAEEAASRSVPIFKDAIREMTILEAFEILQGDDDAATKYFINKSYYQLVSLYEPTLNDALDQDLIGGISANDTWYTLQDLYNSMAESLVGKLADLTVVEIDLSLYLTEKALDGIFLKVAEEEKAIRENPVKRISEILQRVFGSIDQ